MAPIRCCFDQTAVWHSDAARGPSTPSFNHLVGDGEQGWRDGEAKCLRGLEIDYQLELGRLQNWQIRGRFPPENAAGIDANLSQHVHKQGSIAHEATGRSEVAKLRDRGQSMLGCQCG